ncbi:hypothetical protein CCP3SC1AL1_20005 [Gammaproteobacteria bacterium]
MASREYCLLGVPNERWKSSTDHRRSGGRGVCPRRDAKST